jgi:hypothetical protein
MRSIRATAITQIGIEDAFEAEGVMRHLGDS